MNKKNILMIGPDRSVHGGISGVVNGYFEAGLDKKVNLRYIGTMKEGSKFKKLFVAFGAYFKFLFSLGWADVVHVHVASDNSFIRKSLFIRAARRHHKKIIIHQHGGDFINWYGESQEAQQRKIRDVLGMADKMLVLSPSWKTFFETVVNNTPIEVFSNTIKVDASADYDIFSQKKPHTVLFLGRICVTKGIRELMESVPEILEQYPDVAIQLGGIWEDESLRPLIEKYPDNIKYIGWVSGVEKNKYLEESSIYVLPTYFEGQPVSVLEAMAAGCTVVASEVGGIPMMIEDGVDGLLIKPKDVQSLINSLCRALGDEQLRHEIGVCAHKKIVQYYNIDDSIIRLIDIYDGS